MAGSLTLALRTAQSGLLANQEALGALSNNVSNVNTPGYSRKVVNLEQRVVAGAGAGVQISSVTRKLDEGLLKSLRIEVSSLNAYEARDPYYARLQELFGKPGDNTSLSHTMAKFSASLETLSSSPSKSLEQSEAMRNGKELALQLQNMSKTIQELRLQTDAQVASATKRVGELLNSVHTLNNKLIANQAVQVDVTDLKDQRDKALDELSSLIDIRYYYRGDGDAVVFTSGGRTLVDNGAAAMTHVQASAMSATTNQSEGDLNGIYVGTVTAANDITTEIRDGKLKGLLDMRDTILPNLQSQVDEFAVKLRDAVNTVHNAGAPFPGLNSLTGTRNFIDSANQTITFGGTTDTTVALVDGAGKQTALTTVRTLLGGATTTIDNLATKMQTWLRANGASGATVAMDANGHFTLNLNTTSVNLVLRDQAATANGSAAQDATISYDANGASAGGVQTLSGFSNFLGLNDFYVNNQTDNIYDSTVQSSGYTLGTSTTLSFYNAASTTGATIGGVTVALSAGMTLDQIVTTVNATTGVGVVASKVTDGSGFRLRLSEASGSNMVVSASGSFISNIGMKVSTSGTSGQIKVRDDIVSTPGRISRGTLQWDATVGAAGEYLMNSGGDTTIQALIAKLSSANSFSEAGGLTTVSVNFETYASAIIGNNSSLSSNNTLNLGDQKSLTDSLQAKSDNFRGVNMDEEMANLILYQQAYGASARIITSIQKMFDALQNIV